MEESNKIAENANKGEVSAPGQVNPAESSVPVTNPSNSSNNGESEQTDKLLGMFVNAYGEEYLTSEVTDNVNEIVRNSNNAWDKFYDPQQKGSMTKMDYAAIMAGEFLFRAFENKSPGMIDSLFNPGYSKALQDEFSKTEEASVLVSSEDPKRAGKDMNGSELGAAVSYAVVMETKEYADHAQPHFPMSGKPAVDNISPDAVVDNLRSWYGKEKIDGNVEKNVRDIMGKAAESRQEIQNLGDLDDTASIDESKFGALMAGFHLANILKNGTFSENDLNALSAPDGGQKMINSFTNSEASLRFSNGKAMAAVLKSAVSNDLDMESLEKYGITLSEHSASTPRVNSKAERFMDVARHQAPMTKIDIASYEKYQAGKKAFRQSQFHFDRVKVEAAIKNAGERTPGTIPGLNRVIPTPLGSISEQDELIEMEKEEARQKAAASTKTANTQPADKKTEQQEKGRAALSSRIIDDKSREKFEKEQKKKQALEDKLKSAPAPSKNSASDGKKKPDDEEARRKKQKAEEEELWKEHEAEQDKINKERDERQHPGNMTKFANSILGFFGLSLPHYHRDGTPDNTDLDRRQRELDHKYQRQMEELREKYRPPKDDREDKYEKMIQTMQKQMDTMQKQLDAFTKGKTSPEANGPEKSITKNEAQKQAQTSNYVLKDGTPVTKDGKPLGPAPKKTVALSEEAKLQSSRLKKAVANSLPIMKPEQAKLAQEKFKLNVDPSKTPVTSVPETKMPIQTTAQKLNTTASQMENKVSEVNNLPLEEELAKNNSSDKKLEDETGRVSERGPAPVKQTSRLDVIQEMEENVEETIKRPVGKASELIKPASTLEKLQDRPVQQPENLRTIFSTSDMLIRKPDGQKKTFNTAITSLTESTINSIKAKFGDRFTPTMEKNFRYILNRRDSITGGMNQSFVKSKNLDSHQRALGTQELGQKLGAHDAGILMAGQHIANAAKNGDESILTELMNPDDGRKMAEDFEKSKAAQELGNYQKGDIRNDLKSSPNGPKHELLKKALDAYRLEKNGPDKTADQNERKPEVPDVNRSREDSFIEQMKNKFGAEKVNGQVEKNVRALFGAGDTARKRCGDMVMQGKGGNTMNADEARGAYGTWMAEQHLKDSVEKGDESIFDFLTETNGAKDMAGTFSKGKDADFLARSHNTYQEMSENANNAAFLRKAIESHKENVRMSTQKMNEAKFGRQDPSKNTSYFKDGKAPKEQLPTDEGYTAIGNSLQMNPIGGKIKGRQGASKKDVLSDNRKLEERLAGSKSVKEKARILSEVEEKKLAEKNQMKMKQGGMSAMA